MKRGIIVLGSSNSQGETFKAAKYISDQTAYPIVDLKAKNILPFDYEFNNRNDDFFPLIKEIVGNYDLIIVATPVYWYTMSGTMKIFFDRISDCLKTEKETGRKLRGMDLAVLSSGSDRELKNGFLMPFIETANYLGMNYVGNIHSWLENGNMPEEVIQDFGCFIKRIVFSDINNHNCKTENQEKMQESNLELEKFQEKESAKMCSTCNHQPVT